MPRVVGVLKFDVTILFFGRYPKKNNDNFRNACVAII